MTLVETINAEIKTSLEYLETDDSMGDYRVLDGWDEGDIVLGYVISPPDKYTDYAPIGELEIQLPDNIVAFFRRHPSAVELVARHLDGVINARSLLVYVATDIVYYLI